MVEYCTQSATEEDFNTVVLDCGLCVEVDDGDGNITVQPVSYLTTIDRIGPITMPDGTVYPEYYTNIRLMFEPTPEQDAALTAISIDPSQPHYRTFM